MFHLTAFGESIKLTVNRGQGAGSGESRRSHLPAEVFSLFTALCPLLLAQTAIFLGKFRIFRLVI